MQLQSELQTLKGIGPKSVQLFHRLGIRTVEDLLRYFPRDYVSYKPVESIATLREGYYSAISGIFKGTLSVARYGKRSVTGGTFDDGTGTVRATWFNMPYLRSSIKPGTPKILWGKAVRSGNGFRFEQPECYDPAKYAEKCISLQPVYTLTTGLRNSLITKALTDALSDDELRGELFKQEFLPMDLVTKHELCTMLEALNSIHFPEDREQLDTARKRLAYEEFLLFLLSFRYRKQHTDTKENGFPMTEDRYSAQLLSTLPYELTNGQKQVWNEIRSDMSGATAMSRLVQGDVGSGKTVLAVLALLLAISNGYQGAYMAPTEVLARQHYEKISSLLKDFPVKVGLLVGSMKESEKRTMRTLIEDGEIDLIIGTHALIQESVNYHDLGLVITDEQHRFGVRQREMLARKGRTPHVLVMSATPIPRTLALILYGDLDISLLKELPGNRQKIRNCVIDTGKRETAYRFIGSQLLDGHQVYVICPMIEPAENMDGEDVISYAEHLKDIFPKTTVGILHGQMKGDEKSAVMTAFQKNEIGILVSTTVVEVGVDVPNATVMMIENAERFGLSTLHQLRGRVGRGSAQSYCILVSGSEQEHARKRLDMLAGTNDGFEIAEYDLKMRGPGEFCGERQSGLLAFGIADIYEDSDLLSAASQDASNILKRDPELELPEHLALKERLRLYETETLTL